MKDLMKRIAGRIKKYIVPIVALPLVLGLFGYMMPKGQTAPADYTASVTISTGNYGESLYNNAKEVPLLLKNEPFLKEVFPGADEEELAEMKEELGIDIRSDSLFNLSYTGPDKEETLNVLQKIKDAYLKEDQKLFLKRDQVIDKNIKALEGETVSDDSKVDKQRFLYELETNRLDLKAAEEIEPLTVLDNAAGGMSPKKRAVLGILIGLALSFFIIVVPEVFRER
ncbi:MULTISPECIES: teichuronic acid biosynthesis protein TuaF [Bacillus]|uniref:teichuronic acid biosynthesis protein TuaF n=1 Tax=Bacillus TaxID=1386 RepID=UPI0004970DEF|nr:MULTISPECIES: hypothetical protein [Bacillus subtilis group]MCY8023577.1 hypothetical protein [Bacillus sonorensis]MCY8033454.1 hypothetical protein [Bacillus sonorensis]MCY8270225.1 hypothetical protein [Bacillus sonorensis]MCY8402984.1 hypothetical protein [Bacillus sonorensis]MCY8562077.1 hypothetical protein [Bacillus sonorensis]